MKLLVRTAVLGLAAYGAKNLYERYREAEPRLREQGRNLTKDVRHLADEAKGTAEHAKTAATETAATMAGDAADPERSSSEAGTANTGFSTPGASSVSMQSAHPGA